MSVPQEEIHRVARQHLETSRLFGIDFLPVRIDCAAPADAPAPQHTQVSTEIRARQAMLDELRARHEASCPHCTTATSHTQPVFGEGSAAAELMFVGEAPGEEEDRTGRPFIGRAGQKLNEIIRAMGFAREDVYIANILKARPPGNRTPQPLEVEQCSPFLAEQIRVIHPRVIVALGGPASKFLLRTDIGITRLRGQWGMYQEGEVEIPVMPTFHPAYLLRQYTRENRERMWADMQAVLARLGSSP